MAEHDSGHTATGPPAAAGARPPGAQPWQHRAAMLAGSTTALVLASLAGSALGFLNKAACRSGDWNIYLKQFQAHCYTDIYPLYFNEQLSAGKVPYTGHPVEYPVLIGAVDAGGGLGGPAHLGSVRPGAGVLRRHRAAADAVRRRGHAGHRVPGGTVPPVDRAGRRAGPRADPGLVHQLGPDRDGPGRARHGGVGRPPDASWPGYCSAWRWPPSSTRCCSSARCCCCACGPGACAPSGPPRCPPLSRGWWSTCRSPSPHRRAGAGSTR